MAFAFQTATQPVTSTAPTFGTPSSAPGGGSAFSFGAPTQPQQPPPAAASQFSFGLGGQAATATSTPAATSAFSFGTPATAIPSTAASTFGAPLQQPAASAFSFAPPAASLPTSTTQNFGFGLGSNAAPTMTTSQTATTAVPVVLSSSGFGGLGGVPSTGATNTTLGFGFSGGLNAASKSNDPRAVKELPVPMEVMQIIEELKLHMKNHKVKMTEMNRASDKNIEKVVEETEDARIAISNLTNMVHRQGLFCNSLMRDIQEEMKNVDMAMVTRDTPLVLQNEITAPGSYFYRLVTNYQDRMLSYKREIERAELALSSLVESQGFSPRDLITALKGTKETVLSLAAKIQDFHEQVVNELITHRNLKRFAVGDTNVIKPGWGSGVSGRSMSAGGSSFGLSTADGLGSITRMEPVIPSSINQSYHRIYDKVNVLFNTPPRMGDHSSYRPGAITSTPAFPRPGLSGYSSPPPLFQTASSTILGSPGISGSALKRSKR